MIICNIYGKHIEPTCKLLIYALHNGLFKQHIRVASMKKIVKFRNIHIGYGYKITIGNKYVYKNNTSYTFNISEKHIYKLYCIYGDQIMKML